MPDVYLLGKPDEIEALAPDDAPDEIALCLNTGPLDREARLPLYALLEGLLIEEAGGLNAYDNLTTQATKIKPGSEGCIFLPYLSGERTPHNNPHVRGSFHFIKTSTKSKPISSAFSKPSLRDNIPSIVPSLSITLIGSVEI